MKIITQILTNVLTAFYQPFCFYHFLRKNQWSQGHRRKHRHIQHNTDDH